MQAVSIQNLNHEIKIKFLNDGIHFRAVDPAHAELLHIRIPKGACDEYDLRKTGEIEIGIDIDKLKVFAKIFKKNDVFELNYDPNSHKLIIIVGHLTRTMGLIDTLSIPDPETPKLRLRNKIFVDSKLFRDNLEEVLCDDVTEEGIELVIITDDKGKTTEEYIDVSEVKHKKVYAKAFLSVLPDRILFENESYDEEKSKTKKSSILANNEYLDIVYSIEKDNITGLDAEVLLKRVKKFSKYWKKICVMLDYFHPVCVFGENGFTEFEYWLAPCIPDDVDTNRVWEVNKKILIKEEVKLKLEIQKIKVEPELNPEFKVKESIKELEMPEKITLEGQTSIEKPQSKAQITLEKTMGSVIAVQKTKNNGDRVIGCLARIRTKTGLIGEIIGITKTGYLIYFSGQKSRTLKEPVEIERDLVEVL